eukprot:scaffold45721_cov18-Tisochrysis_lutea.AAC.1
MLTYGLYMGEKGSENGTEAKSCRPIKNMIHIKLIHPHVTLPRSLHLLLSLRKDLENALRAYDVVLICLFWEDWRAPNASHLYKNCYLRDSYRQLRGTLGCGVLANSCFPPVRRRGFYSHAPANLEEKFMFFHADRAKIDIWGNFRKKGANMPALTRSCPIVWLSGGAKSGPEAIGAWPLMSACAGQKCCTHGNQAST